VGPRCSPPGAHRRAGSPRRPAATSRPLKRSLRGAMEMVDGLPCASGPVSCPDAMCSPRAAGWDVDERSARRAKNIGSVNVTPTMVTETTAMISATASAARTVSLQAFLGRSTNLSPAAVQALSVRTTVGVEPTDDDRDSRKGQRQQSVATAPAADHCRPRRLWHLGRVAGAEWVSRFASEPSREPPRGLGTGDGRWPGLDRKFLAAITGPARE
jgi:hypothetical protein